VKTLILVRHAKSDRKGDPAIKDFDRPLNRRGERDAPVMAERFAETGRRVDALISSPACRALATAEAFSRKLNLPVCPDEQIYDAACVNLLQTARNLDDRLCTVALFGHNPGITDFLNELISGPAQNMPTCSFAVIKLPAGRWRDIEPGTGRLVHFASPKG
jgi:phosphohistidine phosphatase